jgi:hypothetical protein
MRQPLKNPDDEAAFQRTLAASRHLAEHMGEAPALVMVLMPEHLDDARDADGPLDVGTPFASSIPPFRISCSRPVDSASAPRSRRSTASIRDEVRAICAIPARYEIVALIPMGRPQGKFGRGRRRPAEQGDALEPLRREAGQLARRA